MNIGFNFGFKKQRSISRNNCSEGRGGRAGAGMNNRTIRVEEALPAKAETASGRVPYHQLLEPHDVVIYTYIVILAQEMVQPLKGAAHA